MRERRRPGQSRLATRLLVTFALVYLALIGLFAVVAAQGVEDVIRRALPEDEVAEAVDQVGVGLARAGAVAGVIGLVVVGLVARRLASPIRELTEVATEVAEGRLDLTPGRSSVHEIDRLGTAVGRMASELGRRIRETEEERRTLEVALGALPEGVLMVESDDRVGYANPAAYQILGRVPERLPGLTPAALQRLVREARNRRWTVEADLDHGTPTRRLHAVASPCGPDDRRTLVVVADVTERHRVEAMRRDFVADASHELKTPVTAVLASAESMLLALERDPDRAHEFAARVCTSANQLARLVEDLLDLSRLEVSEVPSDPVALHEVVAEEARRFEARAGEAGVRLSIETTPVEVRGSAPDLALAVRNLCDNAVRFTDSGGSVEVVVTRNDGWAVVEVADTGAGIPTRALPRVFERFFRVDVARARATGGTGLGLAIVKHVAERHGGRVSVTSELGAGSTFRLEIPANGALTTGTAPSSEDAHDPSVA